MNHSARSTRTLSRFAAIATLTTVATLSATIAPATAGDDEVIRRGSCSGSADWKLKVKTDDGRLEVEGEVDSNNERAAVGLGGSITTARVSARGTATTTGRSGSFSVERRVVNLAGTDTVVFRAEHQGQICRGVVNY